MKNLAKTKKNTNFVLASACGVIGSRVRLRIWCLRTWGFESLHAHYIPSITRWVLEGMLYLVYTLSYNKLGPWKGYVDICVSSWYVGDVGVTKCRCVPVLLPLPRKSERYVISYSFSEASCAFNNTMWLDKPIAHNTKFFLNNLFRNDALSVE